MTNNYTDLTKVISEKDQFYAQAHSLLKMLDENPKSNERSDIREQIARLLTEYIDFLNTKDAFHFRSIVVEDSRLGDIEKIDIKLSKSKGIKADITKSLQECPNLKAKIDLYNSYRLLFNGHHGMFIIKMILDDENQQRILESNSIGINFLILAASDLSNLKGLDWESDYARKALIDKITSKESISKYVKNVIGDELAICKDTIEKINVFDKYLVWGSSFALYTLNEIKLKCNGIEIKTEEVVKFFISSIAIINNYDDLNKDNLLERDRLINGIMNLKSVKDYIINNKIELL